MNWTMQDDYLNWNGIISNEDEKINIAKKVAEKVKDGEVIGFGSGSTSFLTIKEIAKKIKNENLKIKAIPTSYETKLLCSALEIPTVSIIEKKPDWCFDGTDEIDENNWLIKGRGAAMFKEKINILNSPKVYILADESKFVKKLGDKFKIPKGKDGPVITENNNLIIDSKFNNITQNLEKDIKSITGVIESGLFINYSNIEVIKF